MPARLGWRRLLPQPRGFESAGAVHILDHAPDLRVAHRIDLEEALVDLHPAPLTASGEADGHENSVIALDELLGLDAMFVPGLHPFDEAGPHPLDPVIRALRGRPLDLGVKE